MIDKSILVAGIGAGSLGLELLKCILLDASFRVYGCDSNSNAVGLTNQSFRRTLVTRSDSDENFLADIIEFCEDNSISFLVPGAEATNRMITLHQDLLRSRGIVPLVNSVAVYELCSDKVRCAEFLCSLGLPSARSLEISTEPSLEFDLFPCVVKPARESGASNLVFLAENREEAIFFVKYLARRGSRACIQQYIQGEEYSVGVMSDERGRVISSVALKRDLSSKLSTSMRYGDRVISSGWSQGEIDRFPLVCQQSETIASSVKSTWALNIQGRLQNDVFYPFEINPRHSGTSYFRALSGVNEILLGINSILGVRIDEIKVRPARYYRVLEQTHSYRDEID